MINKISLGIIQLVEADHSEFMNFFAVYRDNIRFRRDWNLPLYSVPENKTYYWIMHQDHRIGGALIASNKLGPIFSIPPHKITDEIFHDLLSYVRSISDAEQSVEAVGVLSSQLELFERNGFVAVQTRRCMMHPTVPSTGTFLEEWMIQEPTPAYIDELVSILYTSFVQGTGDSVEDSKEDLKEYLTEFFIESDKDTALLKASTVVIDKITHSIVGVCLIGRVEGWPFISYVAVLPAFRGRGLASAMILHSLASLHKQDPLLLLFVTVGNKAEKVYENLGFWSAPTVTQMKYNN